MNKIYKISTFILFLLIIILSIKIFNRNLYININKEYYANLYNITFNFKDMFKNIINTQSVNNEINYIKIDDNKYLSSSNSLCSLKEGFVVNVDYNLIMINQIDDYILVYKGEFDPFIYLGDYIDENTIISNYYGYFDLYFIKNNKQYLYEEYIRATI